MPDHLNKQENINIDQLIEENFKLKKLLRENNIEFEDTAISQTLIDKALLAKSLPISRLAYWKYDLRKRKIESSIEAYKMLEFPVTEDLDKIKVVERIDAENRESFLTEFKRKLEIEDAFTIDTRILVPDGSIKYISINVITERGKQNELLSISGTVTDSTESHFIMEELQGNEKLFRSLFNNLTDIFIIFEIVKDQDGAITDYIYKDVNPAFEMKMGTTKQEIIEKRLSNRLVLFQQLNPLLQLSIIAGQPQQDRLFIQSLDSFYDILIYSPTENKLATIWRDVTLMVEAESSLKESEEKYRQIFSIGGDALFMFDFFSGRILDVNPTGCKLFGYTRETLLRMLFKQLSLTPEKIEEQIKNQKALLHDFIALKSNSAEFPVEISLSYFNWSGRKVSIASIRDISERIIAQENLIKSEQKFKQLFDYSNDAILLIKNYRIIDFNQKSITLFDLPAEELLSKTLWNLSPSKQSNGEESRNKAVEYIQNSLIGNQLQFEWIFQQPKRNTFIADIKLSPIIVGSEKIVQAIVRDISPQKEIEKALVSKEKLWKTSLQISSIGVWEWNLITKEVYYSTVLKTMLGFEKDEIHNKLEELTTRIHPEDIENFNKTLDDYLNTKSNEFLAEIRIRCKNGTYKWIRSQGKIFSYNSLGKPEHFIGTHIDITKQKVTEEKLNQEIRDLTFSSNISQLGYWILDLRTLTISGGKNTFSLFGYNDMEQLTLKQIESLILPEDQSRFMSQFFVQTTPTPLEVTFRITVNNATKYILSRTRPVKNAKNILTGFRGTFQDITPLKQDNATISDEKIFYESLTENIQFAIQVVMDEVVVFSNSKTSELLGYSNKEIISKNISPNKFAFGEDHEKMKKLVDTLNANPKQTERIELKIETKNNRIKWIELTGSTIDLKEKHLIIFQMVDISIKKKNENELIYSERQFKSIVTSARNAISIVNNNGKFLYSNDSFITLSGLSVSELKNKSFDCLFSDVDFTTVSKAMEALSLSLSKDYIQEFQQFGNNKIWIKLTIVPIKKVDNEIEYFIFYCEDIDNEKKTILKLEEENKSAIALKEYSPTGFALFNNKHEMVVFNSRFLDDLKISTKPKVKINLSDIEKIVSKQNQAFTQALHENAITTIEFNQTPEKYLQLEINPITVNNEKSVIIYTTDITKQRIKADSLSLQLERFQGIFDNAPLGMILVDKGRNIIISNRKFENYFEYMPSEMNFIKFDSLIDSQHLTESISKFSQLFTGVSNSFNQVLKMNSRSGEVKYINASASSIKDSFGDSKYAILIIEDISQSKTEEQTLLANERLLTLNNIGNSFAHEFNNLLMAIYGNAYLLNNTLKDIPLSRYTNDLLNTINKASDLTHKLLCFSDKNNKINILLNSDDIINDLTESLVGNNRIEVRKISNNKNELILGDPFQLKKAFQHIIENAIESMPSGGQLTIETASVYFEPNETDDQLEKGKYFRIIISDTGTGISPGDLQRIFDPFYSTKPSVSNTGLGLSIARQIINLHKGLIKVYSSNDKGSSFNIYLPIKEVNKSLSNTQPDEKSIVKGSVRILLIDDEEIVRIITSELLSELGYDVYSFSSGINAITFYMDNCSTIDLVLLDKQMPDMDGIEVYNKLKEINQKVKVIILTGYNINQEFENMFSDNLRGYIQKPVSVEKLSRSISEVLYN